MVSALPAASVPSVTARSIVRIAVSRCWPSGVRVLGVRVAAVARMLAASPSAKSSPLAGPHQIAACGHALLLALSELGGVAVRCVEPLGIRTGQIAGRGVEELLDARRVCSRVIC